MKQLAYISFVMLLLIAVRYAQNLTALLLLSLTLLHSVEAVWCTLVEFTWKKPSFSSLLLFFFLLFFLRDGYDVRCTKTGVHSLPQKKKKKSGFCEGALTMRSLKSREMQAGARRYLSIIIDLWKNKGTLGSWSFWESSLCVTSSFDASLSQKVWASRACLGRASASDESFVMGNKDDTQSGSFSVH